MVAFFLPLMKDDTYRGEREVRLVMHGHDVKFARLRFLAKEGYFKPFTTLRFADRDTWEFPIRAIISGPRVDYDLWRRSMEILLAKYDLSHYRIELGATSVSYRGR